MSCTRFAFSSALPLAMVERPRRSSSTPTGGRQVNVQASQGKKTSVTKAVVVHVQLVEEDLLAGSVEHFILLSQLMEGPAIHF